MNGQKNQVVTDILIIGSGPAGSTAARYIKRFCPQLSVTIIDRNKWPRDKPCAAGLPTKIFQTFPEMYDLDVFYGVTRICTEIGRRFGSMNIQTRRRQNKPNMQMKGKIPVGEQFIFAMSKRTDLDLKLLELARNEGVTTFESAEAKAIFWSKNDKLYSFPIRGSDGIQVDVNIGKDHFEIRAKCVVLAVGLKPGTISAVGNLWYPKQPFQPGATISGGFPVSHTDVQKFWGNDLHVYMWWNIRGLPGYFWLFPRCDSVHLGIVMNQALGVNLQDTFKKFVKILALKKRIPDYILDQFKQPGIIKGHPIPFNGIVKTTVMDRLLVCGDAGGFVSAIDGEGIYYSMITGKYTAETIHDLVQSKLDFSKKNLRLYKTKWKKTVGPLIKVSLSIQKLMSKMGDAILDSCNDPYINKYVKLVLFGIPTHSSYILFMLLTLFLNNRFKRLRLKIRQNPCSINWGNCINGGREVLKVVVFYILGIHTRF